MDMEMSGKSLGILKWCISGKDQAAELGAAHSRFTLITVNPGRIVQSAVRLIQEPEVPGSIPVRPHTFVSPSADSRGAVVSYWQKYVHEVLVNCLGGLSLTRKSVVRLTDHPDMTI